MPFTSHPLSVNDDHSTLTPLPSPRPRPSNLSSPVARLTLNALPEVIPVAAGRRELGVVVVGFPDVDTLVLRADYDVLAVVAAAGHRCDVSQTEVTSCHAWV